MNKKRDSRTSALFLPIFWAVLLPVLLCFPFACRMQGVPVVFTVDPSQSHVTVSGTVAAYGLFSAPLTQQTPGSLTAAFGGAIDADLTGTNIQFTGTSLVEAQTNSTPQQPAPGGTSGSAPADYGGSATQRTFLGDTIVTVAIRNVGLDLISPVLPLSNGSFATSSLEFLFSTNAGNSIDYTVSSPSQNGTTTLAGNSMLDTGSAATLSITGATEILTIPISAAFTETSGSTSGTSLALAGQIVATLQIPPPVIGSIMVSHQMVILSVSGVTAQSKVLASADLIHWSAQASVISTLSGQTLFAFPATNTVEFFKIQQ